MSRRRLLALALGAAVLVSIGITVFFAVASDSGDQTRYSGDGLTPANISALTRDATKLPGVPEQVASVSADLAPDPGTVHALGGRVAFAWTKGGRICSSANESAGCLAFVPQPLRKPIEWTSGDLDVAGGGQPPRVYGIATDEVTSVTVELDDGRSIHAKVVDNFYDIVLPADTMPWVSFALVAELKNGGRYVEHVS